MNIFGDLNYLFKKRLEVSNMKEGKDSPRIVEHKNNQESSKINLLDFLKNKNKILNAQLKSIKINKSKIKTFNKVLYKKLYIIMTDIYQIVSINKKIELDNIFHNLNKNIEDFNKNIRISKTLYILKSIENIYLFYSEFIKRYRENIDNNKKYLHVIRIMRKEKEMLNIKVAKKKIEMKKIELQNNIMKKSGKIYITSHMKYNTKLLIKNKKNKLRIEPTEQKEDNFEHFITYY